MCVYIYIFLYVGAAVNISLIKERLTVDIGVFLVLQYTTKYSA